MEPNIRLVPYVHGTTQQHYPQEDAIAQLYFSYWLDNSKTHVILSQQQLNEPRRLDVFCISPVPDALPSGIQRALNLICRLFTGYSLRL